MLGGYNSTNSRFCRCAFPQVLLKYIFFIYVHKRFPNIYLSKGRFLIFLLTSNTVWNLSQGTEKQNRQKSEDNIEKQFENYSFIDSLLLIFHLKCFDLARIIAILGNSCIKKILEVSPKLTLTGLLTSETTSSFDVPALIQNQKPTRSVNDSASFIYNITTFTFGTLTSCLIIKQIHHWVTLPVY